jgi:CheY-like chemotaxis protein
LPATIKKMRSDALRPAAFPDNGRTMNDAPLSAPAGAPLRVLLLDDDTFMLSLLADMIADLGQCQVRCESDAKRALQSLAGTPPDLLVCDLSMPDMDGIEFLHAAAEAGFKGSVMLLSGMDVGVRRSAERLAQAHGLKVLGAYKKPISQAELGAALAPLLPPAAPGDANLYNVTTHSGK